MDLIKNKKRSKNETINGELEEGGRSDHRFFILKRNQKELQNQTSMELEKGPKDPWIHIDFTSPWKFKMVLKKGTTLRELKGSAWRSPEPNVLYRIYCTVQYHAGAVKEDKADFSTVVIEANAGDNESEDKFADTDTEKNLMVDVLKIEIHDNNCMGTHLTPGRKYYSNMPNQSQITIKEDKADFSTVIVEASDGDNESEDKFVDTDTEKNLMVDVLETETHETDCMGTHLTPGQKYYSNMPNESQIVDDVYKIEVDKFNDVDSDFNDWVHAQDIDPGTRGGPSVLVLDVTFRVLTSAVSLRIKTVSQQLNPASRTLNQFPGLEQSIPRKGNN